MEIPDLLLDVIYTYRWYILIPGLILASIVLLRGENRLPLGLAVLMGLLLLFRNHPLIRPLFSAFGEFVYRLLNLTSS